MHFYTFPSDSSMYAPGLECTSTFFIATSPSSFYLSNLINFISTFHLIIRAVIWLLIYYPYSLPDPWISKFFSCISSIPSVLSTCLVGQSIGHIWLEFLHFVPFESAIPGQLFAARKCSEIRYVESCTAINKISFVLINFTYIIM